MKNPDPKIVEGLVGGGSLVISKILVESELMHKYAQAVKVGAMLNCNATEHEAQMFYCEVMLKALMVQVRALQDILDDMAVRQRNIGQDVVNKMDEILRNLPDPEKGN